MKYLVTRTADREQVVIGSTNSKEDAFSIMKNDFEEWFWQKYDKTDDKSFEEVYEEYEEDEYKLSEMSAWLNDCADANFDWDIIEVTCSDVLSKPLSMEEIIKAVSVDDMYVQGNVLVDTDDMIGKSLDEFLDTLSEKLVGNICLMDVRYKPVDTTTDGMIVMEVSGDASEIIKLSDEMLEELKSCLFMHGTEGLEDFTGMDLSSYDDKDTIDNLLDQVASQMPNEELVKFFKNYVCDENFLEKKIVNLEKQIECEKKKLEICGYGKSDLMYIQSLEAELKELKNRL